MAALADPQGDVKAVTEGRCHGVITREPRGTGGFGYDPLFVAAPDGRTMAELSFDEKNRISHRARGLRAAEPYLVSELLGDRGEEGSAPGANTG